MLDSDLNEINEHYPVSNCHFCGSLILFNHYDNGDSFAYCNSENDKYRNCMNFLYRKTNSKIEVMLFGVNYNNICFGSGHRENNIPGRGHLILLRNETELKKIDYNFDGDYNLILDKNQSFQLFERMLKFAMFL